MLNDGKLEMTGNALERRTEIVGQLYVGQGLDGFTAVGGGKPYDLHASRTP